MAPRAAVVLMLALLAGCGSAARDELPPGAEPASSPPAGPPDGRVVPVGAMPEGVVVDPATGLVAVGLRGPDVVALVDGATGTVRRRVPLPAAPTRLALRRAGEPHDVAAAGGRLFVADARAGTLEVLRRGRRVARLQTALQPGGVTPLDGGRRVAVVSLRERVVEVFDVASGKRIARAPAGVGPTQAAWDGGNHLYVTDTAGGALLVYRLRPALEVIRRFQLPGSPYGIAVDARRGRLFVTQTARNQLAELRLGPRPSLIRRYATPRQPDTLAVDPATGRVFVAGKADGVLQLLDPERVRTR
jgi:DNA-binding beta-propeller fold protein YncE